MILTEYYPLILTPQQLNEAMAATSVGPMTIKKVLLQKANTENRNRRVYPKAILEREVSKYNQNMVKTRRALGELDHPIVKPGEEAAGMTVNLKNASHVITEMWWEGDDVYGNIEILDGDEFPAGRIVAGLLKRKIPVGISSRALGSIQEQGDISMVNDDLNLACFDMVSFESTIGSTLNLNEGFSDIQDRFSKFDSILYDIICNNNGHLGTKK